MPKFTRRRTDTVTVRHDNEVTHAIATTFELTWRNRDLKVAHTRHVPMSWEPVAPSAPQPPLAVTGPRYHLDNVRLWWARIWSAITVHTNVFRAPSKADPQPPIPSVPRGTETPGTAKDFPPLSLPPCIRYIRCMYPGECSAARRCCANDPPLS